MTAYHGFCVRRARPVKLTDFQLMSILRGVNELYLYEAVFAGFTATLGNSLLSWTDIDTAGTPGGTNLQSYLMDS